MQMPCLLSQVSTDRLSGTYRTERSAPSSLVAVRERLLTELLSRPRPADERLNGSLEPLPPTQELS